MLASQSEEEELTAEEQARQQAHEEKIKKHPHTAAKGKKKFANYLYLEPKPREDLKKIARTSTIKLREFEEVKRTGPLRNNVQSRSRFALDESSSSSEEVPQPPKP